MDGKQITHEEFVLLAIRKLRKLPKYKGIHTVKSGFNAAFRDYFPGGDPVAVVNALATEGKIVMRFSRGGVLIFLPGEAEQDVSPDEVLGKMGLKQE